MDQSPSYGTADGMRLGAAKPPSPPSRPPTISRLTIEALTIYPPRSIGAAFKEFRATEEWSKTSAKRPARAKNGGGRGSGSSRCSLTATRAL